MVVQQLVAIGAALTLAGAVPAAVSDPLAPHRGRERILVVSAPGPEDATLRQQRAVFRDMGADARERDLVLLEAVGPAPEAVALRAAAGLRGNAFAAVLVGKDGGVKLRSGTVLGPDQLFPLIDAMPMRQDEMRRKP